MEDETQAAAYASADFEQPHSRFIELFQESFPGLDVTGAVIDLGCGPGDITFRIARAFPDCVVHGVDGSPAMLRASRHLLEGASNVRDRVRLIEGLLPNVKMPLRQYDIVISNSLLHQLHDPQVLWRSVRRFAASRAPVFMMDLRRPSTVAEAERLRAQYVGSEPEILQRDFFNSLLAAFEPEEIVVQLRTAGLSHFTVRMIGDRHLIVSGRV